MGAPVLGNNNSFSPQENTVSIRLNFDDIKTCFIMVPGTTSQFMKEVVGRPCPLLPMLFPQYVKHVLLFTHNKLITRVAL